MANVNTDRQRSFWINRLRNCSLMQSVYKYFPNQYVQTWAPTTTIWGSWMASDPTVLNTSWSLLITGISWSIYLTINNNIVLELCRFTSFQPFPLICTLPIAEHQSICFDAILLTRFSNKLRLVPRLLGQSPTPFFRFLSLAPFSRGKNTENPSTGIRTTYRTRCREKVSNF